MKIHNFSAGPCILPQEVFDKMAEAVLNFNNSGSSIMEISHRRADAQEVIDTAISLVKELMNVPHTHEVIFTQGGASLQFVMAPFNLMKLNGGRQLIWKPVSGQKKPFKKQKGWVKLMWWLLLAIKTSIIFQKNLPFLLMWIIFTVRPTIPFLEHK